MSITEQDKAMAETLRNQLAERLSPVLTLINDALLQGFNVGFNMGPNDKGVIEVKEVTITKTVKL